MVLSKKQKFELAIVLSIAAFISCLFATLGCHFMRVQTFFYGDDASPHGVGIGAMGFAMYDFGLCGHYSKSERDEHFDLPFTVAYYAVQAAIALSAIVMLTFCGSCCCLLPRWVLLVAAALSIGAGLMASLQFLLFQSFLIEEPYHGRWMWGCTATVVAVVISLLTAAAILFVSRSEDAVTPPESDKEKELTAVAMLLVRGAADDPWPAQCKTGTRERESALVPYGSEAPPTCRSDEAHATTKASLDI